MINRFSVAGVLALMLAMFVIGTPLRHTTIAQAGDGTPEGTATSTPCGFVEETSLNVSISAAQVPPTCTPVTRVRTATPTASATSAATDTPAATEVPATAVPTEPAPAATATSPGGGTGGEISGPNTGTGDGTAGAAGFSWLLLAGALIAASGAGSLAFGVRRRR